MMSVDSETVCILESNQYKIKEEESVNGGTNIMLATIFHRIVKSYSEVALYVVLYKIDPMEYTLSQYLLQLPMNHNPKHERTHDTYT